MKLSGQLVDEAVLLEIGERITRQRLNLAFSQAELAAQAGIAKRTLERMEAGAPSQMLSFVRVLRVLQMLPNLDVAIPDVPPRPMDLLKSKGKIRKRVSGKNKVDKPSEAWTWDDET